MNHLRIRTKLGLIVGILVLCVLVVAVMGYRRLGDAERGVADVQREGGEGFLGGGDFGHQVEHVLRPGLHPPHQAGELVEFDDRAGAEFENVADHHRRAPQLDRHLHRDVLQYLDVADLAVGEGGRKGILREG